MPSEPKSDLVDATVETTPERVSELPVVARLIVEIRSDGTRTIARGAIEDLTRGEKIGIETNGATPAELIGSLSRQLAQQLVRLPLVVTPRAMLKAAIDRLLPKK